MVIETKKYRLPIILLLVGILFCTVSAILSLDSYGSWFSRSGSVLSFVSVAVQFILSNLRKSELKKLLKTDLRLKEKIELVKEKDVMHEIVSISSIVTGLVGTLIWGYGDLLY